MEIFQAAVQSVEDWVAVHQPDFANGAWFGKVPEDDLGYNANSWSPQMNRIREGFENLANVQISFPPAERRKTVSLPLFEIAYVLVLKAREVPASESTLLGGLEQ